MFLTVLFAALGLLPLVALPLSVTAAAGYVRGRGFALLLGLVTWGSWSAAVTQLLSLGDGLSRGPCLAVWSVYDVVAAILIVRARGRLRPLIPSRRSISRLGALVLGLVAAVWLVELFVDLASPPTTWDSMTYHLGRVAHWLQNRNVWHYPTAIDRQLWMGPWNEWLIAQVQAIAGTDVWANLVQWMEGICAAGLVWMLAGSLGLSRRASWLTVAAFATLPPAVMQGTNTESDLATTMWVLAFLVAAHRLTQRASSFNGVVCGLALGLACLTKGSAFIFTAPFVALWLGRMSWRWRRAAIPATAIAGIAAVLVVGPFLARNYARWHDALGPPKSVAFTNSDHRSPVGTASTLIRTAATQLTTPSSAVNDLIDRSATGLVRAMGQNPNDPNNTFGPAFVVQFARDEDYASAPIHLTLLAVGLVLLFVSARRSGDRRLHVHALAWLVAAVAYASLIRWSPWNNRIELPLLAAGMPFVGWTLERTGHLIRIVLVALFGVSAFAWLAIDDARPLVSISPTPSILTQHRQDIYFEKRPDLRASYLAAMDVVRTKHARRIGLVMNLDDWEYPFFALAPDRGAHMTFFDARPSDWPHQGEMPRPDLVLCTMTSDPNCQPRPGWTVLLDGRVRVLKPT